jgi:hypothetical protein
MSSFYFAGFLVLLVVGRYFIDHCSACCHYPYFWEHYGNNILNYYVTGTCFTVPTALYGSTHHNYIFITVVI